jgi:hypothetical protein
MLGPPGQFRGKRFRISDRKYRAVLAMAHEVFSSHPIADDARTPTIKCLGYDQSETLLEGR